MTDQAVLRSLDLKRVGMLCVLIGLIAASLPSSSRAASGTVNVFYAAAVEHFNEAVIGPEFSAKTGYSYQGKGAGSLAIANQIKGKLATPDVVELADPAVNATLQGQQNGNYVSWYFTFARTELVIGFNPHSRFVSRFRAVQEHKLLWYKALLTPGLRLGRTDPNLDPKGYRALFMAGLAQSVYHLKHFKKTVFGTDTNPDQIFPEETLVSRLLTGQLDAGIFFLSEVKALKIPYFPLPAEVNFGSFKYAKLYATQHFTTSSGLRVIGGPILFTITIPSTVQNEAGAEAFVRYVLGKKARAQARALGLPGVTVTLSGKRGAVPPALRPFVGKR